MTYVTCRLTAKNGISSGYPTLGNRVWATFNFFTGVPNAQTHVRTVQLRHDVCSNSPHSVLCVRCVLKMKSLKKWKRDFGSAVNCVTFFERRSRLRRNVKPFIDDDTWFCIQTLRSVTVRKLRTKWRTFSSTPVKLRSPFCSVVLLTLHAECILPRAIFCLPPSTRTSCLHFHHPSPLHSFTPGLKPSFSSSPPSHLSLPFLLPDWLHGFPGLFTDTSERIRFYFLVFLFSTF